MSLYAYGVNCLKKSLSWTVVMSCLVDSSMMYNPTAQTIEVFQWMPKEHLCILVYLVSVYHAVQAGHLEKAQTYSEKALAQIQALKCKYCCKWLGDVEVVITQHYLNKSSLLWSLTCKRDQSAVCFILCSLLGLQTVLEFFSDYVATPYRAVDVTPPRKCQCSWFSHFASYFLYSNRQQPAVDKFSGDVTWKYYNVSHQYWKQSHSHQTGTPLR